MPLTRDKSLKLKVTAQRKEKKRTVKDNDEYEEFDNEVWFDKEEEKDALQQWEDDWDDCAIAGAGVEVIGNVVW